MAKAPKIPGEAAEQASQPLQESAPEQRVDHLPNAVDVDLDKITGPVLTRQGWLVARPRPT